MADLAPVTYGTVHGRFVMGALDSADAGVAPDAIPLGGYVEFSLSASYLLVAGAVPDPTTIYSTRIRVFLDEDGYLANNGTRDVTLIATDSVHINPTGVQWQAKFFLRDADGNEYGREPFYFSLPGGATVDLTTVTPVALAGGVQTVVGPPGPNNVYVQATDPGLVNTPYLWFKTVGSGTVEMWIEDGVA